MKTSGNINDIIKTFSKLKAMVIGDVMVDAYIFGKVDRISPEAPVPVVHISKRESRPGGAANVAINIQALGATPILCSVTGDDEGGKNFKTLLETGKLNTSGILQSKNQKTTIKTRVIGNNHQLLRVDDEQISNITGETEKDFIIHCLKVIESEKPDVIIFEDYDKGVITTKVIESITAAATAANIPVTVDPKRKNFNGYKNITLFKPNLHELSTGLGIQIENNDTETLKSSVKKFMDDQHIAMVMVTLSEAGVFIASGKDSLTIPAHRRAISDVSGAGDTVISVASLCVAAGLSAKVIAGLSNLAGGLVCEEVGVVPINKQKFIDEVERNPFILDVQ